MQNKYISEEAYYDSMNKNPVYVVLMNGGTPLSKIISGFTGDTYTHACISFNAKLKPLYSFGLTNDSTFGFAVANPRDKKAFPHIDKYAVYVMYVSNHQLYKMKKRLKWFIDNGKDLKFDFPALVSVFFQKDTENHSDKYFCSRFVAEILKMGEVDLEKKASLYRPESLLALSNISLVNWGRDIIGYNWIKTRDNERLIKQNRYVHPMSLIPKFESSDTSVKESITYSKSFKDVKNIVDSLPKKDLWQICNGDFKDPPYLIYRNVLICNGDPAAFIDVCKLDDSNNDDGFIVIACKPKYRRKGFPTQLVHKLKNDKSFKWSHLIWECAKNNVASSTLAKKIGLELSNETDKEYEYSLYRESVIYDNRDFDAILEDSFDIRVSKAARYKNNTRLLIASKEKLGDVLKPKSYKVKGKQENFCILTRSIDHALMMLGEFCLGREYFIYQTEDIYDLYNPKDDERIYPKCVSEVWIKSPVKISYMKKIKVIKDMFYPKYKNNPPEDIGSINNLYAWNTIETEVQHDSTWIKESGSTLNKSSNPLLNNIIEFNAKTNVMEYIIPNNGNIITKFDYKTLFTKYRVLSPEKFKKYNGGICWDYVIYESYYFNKNFRNVPYKAFYHSFINDRTNPAHTFILFYLSGKVYWFESSLKDLRGVYEFANEIDALSYITRELYSILDSSTSIRIRDSFLTTYNPLDITTYNMTLEQYTDYMFTKPKYEYVKKNNPKYIRKYLGTEEFDIDQYHTESKSNNQIYFISDKNMNGKVLSPRIPDNYFTRHGYEDTKTKRVCFTPSIDKSLMALSNNITGKEFYVHIAIGEYKVYKPTVKQVPDSKVTGELWVTKPVKVSCIGKIKVISDMGLPGHKFSYGDKEAELYDWKWEWVERLNSVVESCSTLDIYITESNQKSTVLLDFKKKSGIKFAFIDIHDSRAKKYLDKNSFYKKNFKKIMSITNGEIAVDVDNDKLAGYIYVGAGKKGQDKNYGFIQTLEVLKQYRGYGLSNNLLDDAIKKYNAVDLTVYKDNEVALKLYKKHGFVIIGYGNSKDKSDYWMKLKTKLTKDEKIMNEAAITEACKNPREARRFVQDAEKLAKKYNANYFLVTDGASGTNNKDNKAVKYCRDALKEWERKNKFNPDEDWRKNPDDFSDYKLEETMLYEFANKELLDKIHVTSDTELSKWMKSNIKYQEFKTLMTPEEVFESRMGSCHDQVVFELAVLKALKYSPKALFFIEYNEGDNVGGQTHSFVYYRRGTKFYWFENAWGGQAGIHGPYKNVKELKNDIISKHDTKKYKKLQFASFKGKEGMTLAELVEACLK